jgi:hypothetical protein
VHQKKNELFFQLRHDTDKQAGHVRLRAVRYIGGGLFVVCSVQSHRCKLCSTATNIVENEEPFIASVLKFIATLVIATLVLRASP